MSHIQPLVPPDAVLTSAAPIPAIALFSDDAEAGRGIAQAGARLLRNAAPGVVLLVNEEGLAQRLYDAGALLVFG
ncbi:hypothetical protein ACQW02_18435 [Humitalea sp. 24SJ18S-53]|uniref:hypothetical protein n=1 Tax=Humitalea sp. 24SJ18S-53 TaxID=3422307 RepID=UPI003D67EBB4